MSVVIGVLRRTTREHLSPHGREPRSGVMRVPGRSRAVTGVLERDLLLDCLRPGDETFAARRLVDVCRALVEGGILQTADRNVVWVEDEGAAFSLPLGESDAPLCDKRLGTMAARALSHARVAVLTALRGLRGDAPDTVFLERALYNGRLVSVAGERGQRRWQVSLQEGESLTDWLLALLAADVWQNRDGYRCRLEVCDECDRVSIDGAGDPRCDCEHADDSRELPTRPELRLV